MILLPFLIALSCSQVELGDVQSVNLESEAFERFVSGTEIPDASTWTALPEGSFEALPARSPLEFGYNAKPTLLRTALHSTHPGTWWLVSTLRTPGEIEIRFGGKDPVRFGSAYPFEATVSGTFDQAVQLELDRPCETLFVKVREPLGPCNLKLQLVPESAMPSFVQSNSLRIALVIGYLSAILLVSCYLWWAIRDPAIGWYAAYLAFAIGWYAIKRGVAFAYIWPNHPQWNPHASPSLAFLATATFAIFISKLLELPKQQPRISALLKGLSFGLIFFGLLSWSDRATESGLLRLLANTNLFLLVGGLLATLGFLSVRKHRLALQILIAFLPLAVAMAFGVMVEFGLFENGHGLKSAILSFAAILENTLTTLILVREASRREKKRIALEEQFHRRVVERTDMHLADLAKDLHDNLSQQAVALRMKFFGLRKSAPAAGNLTEIEDRFERFARDIRDASHRIYPPLLEQGVLSRALERLCRDADAPGTAIEFLNMGTESVLPKERGIHLYRIVQEAIGNAIRHGKADRIDVELSWSGEELRLSVTDNGTGFVTEPSTEGLGFWSIRSRVATVGGALAIRSAPGRGTRIEVRLANLMEGNAPPLPIILP